MEGFKDKVKDLTSQNVKDITYGLQIKSIEGIVDRDGMVTRMDIWVADKPGSSMTDLREIVLHMSDGNGFYDVKFNNESGVFPARAVIDNKLAFTQENPVIEKGDVVVLTVDAKKLGMKLGSGSTVGINFISSLGNKVGSLEIEIETLNYGANKIY